MTIVDRRFSVAEGTAVKAPCRVATTANITLSGLQTIDGVAVVADDRVLVKNQTTGSQNGIYAASTGNWERTRDFDGAYDIVTGTRIFVTSGTANNGSEFYVSTTGTITIDSTSIAITQMPAGLIATSVAAAAASATASASSATASASSATAASVSAAASAASAAAAAASATRTFASRSALDQADVGSSIKAAICLGYANEGDCAPIAFKRIASEPRYGGVRSFDSYLPNGSTDVSNGGWWGYVPAAAGVDVCAFGYLADWNGDDATATDNAVPLQNAINFTALEFGTGFDTGGGGGGDVLLPIGSAMVGSKIFVHDGVRLLGKGTYGTVIKMKSTFAASDHFFELGTPGDGSAVCASQARGSAGDLTINGTLASGGVARFLAKRLVSVYSAGNDTGITFTIYGTDETGASISDVLTGANNSATDSAEYFATVTRVAASGAAAGNVTVGCQSRASFDSRMEKLQLWSNHLNAQSGKSMVYTNKTQHKGGVKDLKIFAGNRAATWFETGVGGASYFTYEGIETGNYGNAPGVASNNPQVYFNYSGLMGRAVDLVVQGNALSGSSAIGIKVEGGFMRFQEVHFESIYTGLFISIPSVNEGSVSVQNMIGGGGTQYMIHIDSNTDDNTVVVQGIFKNAATYALKDDPGGGTLVANNIIPWTTY